MDLNWIDENAHDHIGQEVRDTEAWIKANIHDAEAQQATWPRPELQAAIGEAKAEMTEAAIMTLRRVAGWTS